MHKYCVNNFTTIKRAFLSKRFFTPTFKRLEQVEITIDGKTVSVEPGTALIQACEKAGIEIPRFCYHDRLSIAGNCRMCLVEVERSPKPVASCAFPIIPNMKVFTNSPMVKRAREGVMEFLLANHPLDCPICDQGGECDLQDQSMSYGSDRSRFFEPAGKRAVEDKNFGPLVKTVMTRCIHCTRCVRFANEVAGVPELGTTGRGNDMQIGTYIEKTLDSEMSGNIIDLCPVGALTSKPYAFTSRPWELKKTESIDVMDAVGSNIRVDSRGLEVMRVLPRLNDEINEEWISDKTRFAYDGLKLQRLTTPLIKQNGKFEPASWPQALNLLAEKFKTIKGSELKAVVGQLADAESMVALKDMFNKLGCENLHYESTNSYPAHGIDFRKNYLFNTTIARIDECDTLLLIGTNPRHEAAIINAQIRKAYLHSGTDVYLIGKQSKLNYRYEHLGDDLNILERIVTGSHAFSKVLEKSKNPMVIVGSAVAEADENNIYKTIFKLIKKYKNLSQENWVGYNLLQRFASRNAALDIGFVPTETNSDPKLVYLLGADDMKKDSIPNNSFVVYQGHHGDIMAQYADVILPGAAYTEKSGTYVNTEGRAQLTRAAVSPPGSSREDWKTIRALSEVIGITLPYNDIMSLRQRMAQIAPNLLSYDELEVSSISNTLSFESETSKKKSEKKETVLDLPIKDFYLTNPIARASSTMAKCSAAFSNKPNSDLVNNCAHQ